MPSRIAICLFEDHIDRFELPELLVGESLKKIKVEDSTLPVELFVKESSLTKPEWTNIVSTFADLTPNDLNTSTSGAILFVKIKNRILACCFGSSVSNINRNNLITDFGLAVAFSRILKRNIKSIETYTLSTNPIINNRSSAIPTSKDSFNLDDYLENITELSGLIYGKSRPILVKGKEFYSSPSPLNIKEIISLCETVLSDYNKAINDETYKRMTSTKKIKERKMIDFLDNELSKKINKRHLDIFLVDYEPIQDISSYRLSPKGKILETISIIDIYSELLKSRSIATSYLKDKRITIIDSDDQKQQWSLYKCLFSEINIGNQTFILYKGSWYELQPEYLNTLREYLRSHEVDITSLPKWNMKDPEGKYNLDSSKKIKGQCWDKKLYRHPDYPSGIEFCDILTEDNIIHVKKYGSSSLNSHLLFQTAVSAFLLVTDRRMKSWIKEISKKEFKKNILLKANNELKNRDINYLVVLLSGDTSNKLYNKLPFFSLISFNLMIRKIVQLGFKVNIGQV